VRKPTKNITNDAPAASAQAGNGKPPTLYTVNQYPDVQPGFTEAALRSLIFNARPRKSSKGVVPGNGLVACGAILRVGKKVLIDDQKFIEWVRKQSQGVK
jgi:hypothetical protein